MVTGLDTLRKEVDALLRGDHSSYPHTLVGMMQYLTAREEAEINGVTPPYNEFFEQDKLLNIFGDDMPLDIEPSEEMPVKRRKKWVTKSRRGASGGNSGTQGPQKEVRTCRISYLK